MANDDEKLLASGLRNRSDAELESLLASKGEELHRVKFKKALGQMTETHVVRSVKKDIARVKTVLAERQSRAEA